MSSYYQFKSRGSAAVAREGTHQEVVNAWHCAIQAINEESRRKQSGQCLLSPVEAWTSWECRIHWSQKQAFIKNSAFSCFRCCKHELKDKPHWRAQPIKAPRNRKGTVRLKPSKAWLARMASSEGSQGLNGNKLSPCLQVHRLWLVQADWKETSVFSANLYP